MSAPLSRDPMEGKILEMLYEKDRLRFSEIRDSLSEKIPGKNYVGNSLAVVLTRKLRRLEESNQVKKTVEGHKLVYYSLTRSSRTLIRLFRKNWEWFSEQLTPKEDEPETTESVISFYLTIVPHMILEMLVELYRCKPVSSEMLKLADRALNELTSNAMHYLIDELGRREQQGENINEILKRTEKWRFVCIDERNGQICVE